MRLDEFSANEKVERNYERLIYCCAINFYSQMYKIAVPGDLLSEETGRAGEGTYVEDGKVYASRYGVLNEKGEIKVMALSGKYVPTQGDVVIGKVVEISFPYWIVDIASPYEARLHSSEFAGAGRGAGSNARGRGRREGGARGSGMRVSAARGSGTRESAARGSGTRESAARGSGTRESAARGRGAREERIEFGDMKKYLDLDDLIVAKVAKVDALMRVDLALEEDFKIGRGSGGGSGGGRLLEISHTKVPRVIGRSGSMVRMLKEKCNCSIFIAENGRIWIKGSEENMNLVSEVISKIVSEAHTAGLTDRIADFLEPFRGNK
ncbi:MAG: hypothetical protein C4B55_01630 [Candidatus Methanophagaceae archaeon]|nr:MAG: hypothetical protein C4B55_01630 [Methanophagales archaeon]